MARGTLAEPSRSEGAGTPRDLAHDSAWASAIGLRANMDSAGGSKPAFCSPKATRLLPPGLGVPEAGAKRW